MRARNVVRVWRSPWFWVASSGGLVLINLFIGLHLVLQVTSEDPLTRKAVFVIVVDSLVLFLWLATHFFNRILGVLEGMTELHDKQIDLLNATVRERKVGSVENDSS